MCGASRYVKLEDFDNLWEHLGQDAPADEATAEETSDPLWPEFAKYDSNHRGHLSPAEVAVMM